MSTIQVDVGEVATKEIEKRDRKIAKLEKRLIEVEAKLEEHRIKAQALKELRDKVVETTYAIDSYYGDDGP